MKTFLIKRFFPATAILSAFLFSCDAPKPSANSKTTEQAVSDSFIRGTVIEIQNGKDGYTAQVKTAGDRIYFGTISRSNLNDPARYKSVQVGDTIAIKGDQWMMNEQVHITVRELK